MGLLEFFGGLAWFRQDVGDSILNHPSQVRPDQRIPLRAVVAPFWGVGGDPCLFCMFSGV